MAHRIKRSAALFKSSWAVLQAHRSLLLLPIVSAITTLIVIASFAVPVITTLALDDDLRHEIVSEANAAAATPADGSTSDANTATSARTSAASTTDGTTAGASVASTAEASSPAPGTAPDAAPSVPAAWKATGYAYLGLFYLATSFVVIFFNAALVAAANEHFQGNPSGLMIGIRVAMRRLPSIFLWAVVAATVGVILRLISERAGLVGKIVIALIGIVWSIATYFAIPVVVIEGTGPFAAIRRSVGVIKKTWGETLVLAVGFGIVGLFVAFVGIGLLVAGGVVIATGVAQPDGGSMATELIGAFICLSGIVVLVAWSILAGTLRGIAQTALYLFASTGQVPDGFQREHLEAAFQSKPKRKSFGLG